MDIDIKMYEQSDERTRKRLVHLSISLNVSSFLFGISSLSAMIIAVIELDFFLRFHQTGSYYSQTNNKKGKCSAIRCTRIFDDLTASFILSAKNCLHSLKIWHTPSFGYTFDHKNDFFYIFHYSVRYTKSLEFFYPFLSGDRSINDAYVRVLKRIRNLTHDFIWDRWWLMQKVISTLLHVFISRFFGK